MGGGGRGSVRWRTGGRRIGVENELFDGHNLFAIAELLQLAQQRFDLVDEGLALGALELTKDLLCRGVSRWWIERQGVNENVRMT